MRYTPLIIISLNFAKTSRLIVAFDTAGEVIFAMASTLTHQDFRPLTKHEPRVFPTSPSVSLLVSATWTPCVHTWTCPTSLDFAGYMLCRAWWVLEGMMVLSPNSRGFLLTCACASDRLTGAHSVVAGRSPFHIVVARGD